MKRSRDLWILIGMFLALFLGAYFFAIQTPPSRSPVSTTYNPAPKGVKAFYTLLGRLGYRTGRLTRSYAHLPKNVKLLFVVQPYTYGSGISIDGEKNDLAQITDSEEQALLKWIKKGGTVVFLSDRFSKVPQTFYKTRALGKGRIYAFNSRKTIINKGMRDYKNALALLKIIDRHTNRSGLILFDEYHHGIRRETGGEQAISSQVAAALWVGLAALLLLCYSQARRFGAVRNLPASETVRPGFEFVESVGRLYQRAGASNLAAEILCRSFKQGLCTKLGLASDTPRGRVLENLRHGLKQETLERVDKILAGCEPAAGEKLAESELLNIAEEIHLLEKELGLAGFRI